MPTKFVAVIWISGIPCQAHRFVVSDYRSSVSVNAFKLREDRRSAIAYQNKTKRGNEAGHNACLYKRAHIMPEYEYQSKIEDNKRSCKRNGHPYRGLYGVPLREINHATIWDFYKAVDYDFDAKRWIC